MEVRELSSGDSPGIVRSKLLLGNFAGILDQVRGTRLTIRATGAACEIPPGTLVEVATPDQIYLGEIKHCSEGKVYIDFEHELQRSALAAIRKVWS